METAKKMWQGKPGHRFRQAGYFLLLLAIILVVGSQLVFGSIKIYRDCQGKLLSSYGGCFFLRD